MAGQNFSAACVGPMTLLPGLVNFASPNHHLANLSSQLSRAYSVRDTPNMFPISFINYLKFTNCGRMESIYIIASKFYNMTLNERSYVENPTNLQPRCIAFWIWTRMYSISSACCFLQPILIKRVYKFITSKLTSRKPSWGLEDPRPPYP